MRACECVCVRAYVHVCVCVCVCEGGVGRDQREVCRQGPCSTGLGVSYIVYILLQPELAPQHLCETHPLGS